MIFSFFWGGGSQMASIRVTLTIGHASHKVYENWTAQYPAAKNALSFEIGGQLLIDHCCDSPTFILPVR